MTTLDWPSIRSTFTVLYGNQLPMQKLEAELVDIFQEHPALFTAEANRVALIYADGKIHSPWPILRRNLGERLERNEHFEQATANDTSERDRAIRNAENYIRGAGVHLPSESELLAELFGADGLTADLDTLEQTERETRDRPGRAYYEDLLLASIANTRSNGRQTVRLSDGPLTPWDTPTIHARMVALWKQERPRGERVEAEKHEREAKRRAATETAAQGDGYEWEAEDA